MKTPLTQMMPPPSINPSKVITARDYACHSAAKAPCKSSKFPEEFGELIIRRLGCAIDPTSCQKTPPCFHHQSWFSPINRSNEASVLVSLSFEVIICHEFMAKSCSFNFLANFHVVPSYVRKRESENIFIIAGRSFFF